LGSPIAETGKAAVMALANHGSAPKFSKYAGVVQWRNSYFLWVNVSPMGSKGSEYPNQFLDNGREVTWFGGSQMHPGYSTKHLLKIIIY
jgi:hypothetical protein